MAEIRYTRNLFLRCMNIVYLFAFTSLYVQIPGLYGNNGILPARTILDAKEGSTLASKMQIKPSLLWLAPYIGLDTEYMMDVLALIGMFLSFTGFISQKFCCKPIFAALWSLYYSLYQVGQTFMLFQWDTLLLESGFLCILVAPVWYRHTPKKRASTTAPSEKVSFWLVRWLAFRLLFSTGVHKLASGCPSWWGLTALSVHFQNMVLPGPLAYYCHYLPAWNLKLVTVFSNFAELLLPIYFFFPLQAVRTIAFFIELFLQVCIIVTGNFNFYNYLTITLLISLLDDGLFYKTPSKEASKVGKLFKALITITGYGAMFYAVYKLYSLKLQPGGIVDAKIAFTKEEFNIHLGKAFPIIVIIGLFSLGITVLKAMIESFTQKSGIFNKATAVSRTLVYTAIALFVFSDSLVPFSSFNPAANKSVLPSVRQFHKKIEHLRLTNEYGLYRLMTGVKLGRPEVVIEGSNNLEGPWQEYNFLYKPGNVNGSLPLVAPHQPRLDWQMWFAALGTYHQNPWIMSLAYRLLTNQPEVLALLDKAHNPFPNKPPKYVRAYIYYYRYAPWSQRWSKTTWKREKGNEFFPVFTKDHTPLLDHLKNKNIISNRKEPKVTPWIKAILDQLRSIFSQFEAGLLIWSIFMSGFAITLFQKSFFPSHGISQTPQPKKTNAKKTFKSS